MKEGVLSISTLCDLECVNQTPKRLTLQHVVIKSFADVENNALIRRNNRAMIGDFKGLKAFVFFMDLSLHAVFPFKKLARSY